MQIAVTGATGFLGRYIVNHLISNGHSCRCWHRPISNLNGFVNGGEGIEWVPGRLNDAVAANTLVQRTNAVVHGALERQGGWNPSNEYLIDFVQTNLVGSLRLMQAARDAGVPRFVFISTCAVHDVILNDRPLDETHPLWPHSHYGAHKAAIEKFVHSFGLPVQNHLDLGQAGGWGICALRPTGIYGLAEPAEKSRWYRLIKDVVHGKTIDNPRGGKEVHAADVAKAVAILLETDTHTIAGQCYNCCDTYISTQDVAQIAKDLSGSTSTITNLNVSPKNQINTFKIQDLGMIFGGRSLLEQTVKDIVNAVH